MLHIVNPVEWSTDPISGRRLATFAAPADTRRLFFFAEGWSADAEAALAASGRAVPMLCARDFSAGICAFEETPAGPLEIAASYLPAYAAWQTFAASEQPSPVDQFLPDSLFIPAAKRKRVNIARIEAKLQEDDLAGALGELAEAWLGGDVDARSDAASLVLCYLADHPLRRSASLGALAAALGTR